MAGPQRGINKKSSREIYEHDNGTHTHKTTRTTSNKKKSPDKYLEDTCKTNVVISSTVEPNAMKEGKIYSDLCRRFPITSNKGNNKYT